MCQFFIFLLVALCSSVVEARVPFHGKVVRDASYISNSYDYVIVGGGLSGLVVANRLSENPTTTVLVIEAGGFDDGEDIVTIPLLTTGNVPVLSHGPSGTKYDWNLTGTPQVTLQNRSIKTPAGKVVGGGSLINGMVYNRGSRTEYDRWEELGNPGWNFEGLLPYFKKAEVFTPPSSELEREWGIEYEAAFHGEGGFVESSFPKFVWPATRNFVNAMIELGISILKDSMGGNAAGAYWYTLSLNPQNETRSSSKGFYYSAQERQNLHLLTYSQVTKILIGKEESGSLVATGVEFATDGTETLSRNVSANKEVVLAAGTLHTPQILQISGIGDASHLKGLGIEPLVDLPGVGANYQDHLLLATVHTVDIAVNTGNFSNTTWNAEQRALYDTKQEGPYTTASGNLVAFLPLSTFANSQNISNLQSQATTQSPTQYLPPDLDSTILEGYKLQHSLLVRDISSNISAHMEFILSDSIIIPVLQQPFSRGSIRINSTSPFTQPSIDPRYLSNPLDLSLLVSAVQYTRNIRDTNSLEEIGITEVVPGVTVQAENEVEEWVRENAQTIHHHVGTASMLPREFGGVVDGNLSVYGVGGLRVVDASVVPMLPAAHMQGTVYAVAEKAADLIKSI